MGIIFHVSELRDRIEKRLRLSNCMEQKGLEARPGLCSGCNGAQGHNIRESLQSQFKGYGLSMNFEQYVLVGSTVKSYLSWIKDTGKLSAEFRDSILLWQKI